MGGAIDDRLLDTVAAPLHVFHFKENSSNRIANR